MENNQDGKIIVSKSFLPPFDEYTNEISDIWESYCLTNRGEKHKKLETELGNYLGADNVSLFANGTLALTLAINALNIKGEVITTPFTFAATPHTIALNGLKPIFCDVELETFNIDPSKIEALITENTSAIMPVHVFGNPCNTEEIDKIAKKYNLKVIYDAAHAFGVKVDGIPIGNFGDISMFSLHATKVFHTIEGGLLTFKDKNLIHKFELLKNFGINYEKENVEFVGTNAKLNEFQAAMGIVNLHYINKVINERKRIVHLYRNLLKDVKGIRQLFDINGIDHNYAYFPIIVEDEYPLNRDELFLLLKKNNIYSRKYFYPLCSDFLCYENQHPLENAKCISDRILCLPLSPDLKEEDIHLVASVIKNV